jgi:hypothetical protein
LNVFKLLIFSSCFCRTLHSAVVSNGGKKFEFNPSFQRIASRLTDCFSGEKVGGCLNGKQSAVNKSLDGSMYPG